MAPDTTRKEMTWKERHQELLCLCEKLCAEPRRTPKYLIEDFAHLVGEHLKEIAANPPVEVDPLPGDAVVLVPGPASSPDTIGMSGSNIPTGCYRAIGPGASAMGFLSRDKCPECQYSAWIVSVESGERRCAVCEARSEKRDALSMERWYRERLDEIKAACSITCDSNCTMTVNFVVALLQERDSLQRELAEARAERDAYCAAIVRHRREIIDDLGGSDAAEEADHELWSHLNPRWTQAMLDDVERRASEMAGKFGVSAPGPSDAKGDEVALSIWTVDNANACIRGIGKALGIDEPDTKPFGIGLAILRAIESLKSRASLTPLTDPSVRGVLVACADDDQHLSIVVDDVTGRKCVGKLRPASEFAVPAEPAQKLVPLPEGAIVYVPTGEPDRPLKRNEPGIDENGDIWLCECDDDGTSGCSWKPARRVDTALYGVPAERVRKLEAEQVDCMACGRGLGYHGAICGECKSDELQLGHFVKEAERLRKAIETLAGECDRLADSLGKPETTKRICAVFAQTVADDLRAALTPPTAASGETTDRLVGRLDKPFHRPECQCDECKTWCHYNPVPPSAPAAESEGGESSGDGQLDAVAGAMKLMENKLLCFDENDQPRFVEVEPIVAANYKRNLHKAMDLFKQNRALSARLAACEERCKELEGNRKGGIDYDS